MKTPFKNLSRRRKTSIVALAVTGVFIFASAESCDQNAAQTQAQQTTDAYQQAATQTVPYPLDKMKEGGWTERKLLQEHLLRQNNPSGVRYIAWLSQQGQLLGQWPIRGMAFSPDSQLTNSQSINGCSSGCAAVTDAPGDNGTWGPEAGSVAFFTTAGTEIQLPASAIWVESDSPLNLTDKPLITYNVTDKPSVDAGGLKGIGSH